MLHIVVCPVGQARLLACHYLLLPHSFHHATHLNFSWGCPQKRSLLLYGITKAVESKECMREGFQLCPKHSPTRAKSQQSAEDTWGQLTE